MKIIRSPKILPDNMIDLEQQFSSLMWKPTYKLNKLATLHFRMHILKTMQMMEITKVVTLRKILEKKQFK